MEIKCRRIRWLGLVSPRLPCAGHHLVKGNLVGQKPPSAELILMAKLSELKLTWGEVQNAAQNRSKWKEIVVALCPTGDEEE